MSLINLAMSANDSLSDFLFAARSQIFVLDKERFTSGIKVIELNKFRFSDIDRSLSKISSNFKDVFDRD